MNNESWTVKEVALKLGVSERTIQDWCKKNNIRKAPMTFSQKPQYILFQKDIEKTITEIPKVFSEAKQELLKKYMHELMIKLQKRGEK